MKNIVNKCVKKEKENKFLNKKKERVKKNLGK